jgi:hypothetical protein
MLKSRQGKGEGPYHPAAVVAWTLSLFSDTTTVKEKPRSLTLAQKLTVSGNENTE